jgi:cholesterol oxidase
MSPPTRLHVAPRIFFTERRPAGISFTERMTGFWSPVYGVAREPFDRQRYEDAYQRGRQAGRRLDLVITIVAEDLETMLNDPNHQAGFVGAATMTGLTGDAGPLTALVTHGRFRLFVGNPNRIASRKMEYVADIEALDGRRWRLEGFKAIRHGEGTAGFLAERRLRPLPWLSTGIWRDQTRLFFTLHRLGDGSAEHGIGILTLSVADLVRQLLTIRPRGATTVSERCDTVARFLHFFVAVLRDTYGGPLARSRYAPPNWFRRERRALEGGIKTDPHRFKTRDGVELQLTRYRGGNAGPVPVILAPGFGVRADSFAIDTVKTNIVEYLCEQKYDVWLFDYRASPELLAAREAFSLDDIARFDWPAAVKHVRQVTHESRVHVIAHCVGGMSFMMAALGGHLRGAIQSAVCSQVAAHPVGSRLNKIKAMAHLGVLLETFFHQKAMRVTVHAEDTHRRPLLDRALKYYPTEDPCDNPVCRRVKFVFGESYLHANLNRDTHDAIIDMFGDPKHKYPAFASLRALKQLSAIVGAGQLLTEKHEDSYVREENVSNLDFRLCLMSGLRNAIFPPRGIANTYAWLAEIRRRRPTPLRELFVLPIPDYAHMDCFIGARAHLDVFPLLDAWLKEKRLDVPTLEDALSFAERAGSRRGPR